MTKRQPAPKVVLGPHEQHTFDGLAAAAARLREVSMALLNDAVDGEGMQAAVDAYFAACEVAMGPPEEVVDLGALLEVGGIPGTVLGAYFAERALLGRPVPLRERSSGELVPFVPSNLEEMAPLLEEIDRLDPRERAERYLADENAVALAVGIQLAREGANELFPLDPWGPPVFRRCLAAAAIVAATRAAATLSVEEEADDLDGPADPDGHERKHQDLDGMVHAAAAAVDALDEDELEDLASPNFGVISHLVEDLLLAAEVNLEASVAHALSTALPAAFMRGFEGGPPVAEIVHSDNPEIVRLLAAADLAGHLAAERLAPPAEPGSPYTGPRPLIH